MKPATAAEQQHITGEQLALALFEELAPKELDVAQAPHEIGFRRNNVFTEIVDLSLSARRLLDVAYFLVAEDPEVRQIYRFDLNMFKWLMSYTSNNRSHLRTLLREAQKAAIQVERVDSNDPSRDGWGAVPLMGETFIGNGQITLELPNRLQALIKNPLHSHFLSLRFVFKSIHARILYDRVQPWLDQRATPWFDLAQLKQWLSCESKTYEEYKFLASRVLRPAITQIAEVTGIELEYDTKTVPGTKKVESVRFVVRMVKSIESPNAALRQLKALYDTLKNDFGLSAEELKEVAANRKDWDDDYIDRAIEYTRFQIELGKVRTRAGSYLMASLRNGYIFGDQDRIIQSKKKEALEKQSATPSMPKRSIKDAADAVANQESGQRIEEGWALYASMTLEKQKDLLAAFARSPSGKLVLSRLKANHEKLAELVLSNELAKTAVATFAIGFA